MDLLGNGSFANATALVIPILLTKFFKLSNVRVIYHNSVFTNELETLGYNSHFDKMRSFFLGVVEKRIFRNVKTFVLLDLYKRRIDRAIGRNLVSVWNPRYLDAIATLYANDSMELETVELNEPEIPTVLMHGSWGPQKNIEMGLSELRSLKDEQIKFRLVISGRTNPHFPDYEIEFQKVLSSYSDIISEYLGEVNEKDVMNLFLKANLVILPYNAPGGHSAVLEQAIFFEAPAIAIDFPEYREQTKGMESVKLVTPYNLREVLLNMLSKVRLNRTISIHKKLQEAAQSVLVLLN